MRIRVARSPVAGREACGGAVGTLTWRREGRAERAGGPDVAVAPRDCARAGSRGRAIGREGAGMHGRARSDAAVWSASGSFRAIETTVVGVQRGGRG